MFGKRIIKLFIISKNNIKFTYQNIVYFMKAISLQLDDKIFADTENLLKNKKISRNKYINEALAYYNAFNERQDLAKQLKYESKLVGKHSLEIAQELNELDD